MGRPAEADAACNRDRYRPIGTTNRARQYTTQHRTGRWVMKGYGRITSTLIAGWFVFALCGSAMGLFHNDANRLGLAVAVAALAPLLVFAVWFAASEGFRRFAMSLNPRVLTSLQSWRIVGFTFVVLEAHGLLPALFARPAGYGDMTIGATAAYVAWKAADPAHRAWFLLWQVLGIADLVTAVTLGTTTPLIDPSGTPIDRKSGV